MLQYSVNSVMSIIIIFPKLYKNSLCPHCNKWFILFLFFMCIIDVHLQICNNVISNNEAKIYYKTIIFHPKTADSYRNLILSIWQVSIFLLSLTRTIRNRRVYYVFLSAVTKSLLIISVQTSQTRSKSFQSHSRNHYDSNRLMVVGSFISELFLIWNSSRIAQITLAYIVKHYDIFYVILPLRLTFASTKERKIDMSYKYSLK